MRSPEVCTRTGASYRQLDYWSRLGLFGGTDGLGSGSQRDWEDHQVVLVRAFVLISRLLAHPAYTRFKGADALVREAWQKRPDLAGYWLVITPEGITVLPNLGLAEAIVLVDLGVCAQQVQDMGEPLTLVS
jgi:hypothetical protein